MIPSDPLTPLTIPSINTKVNPHSHATLWLFHINLRQRLAVEETKRKGENGFLLIHIHIFFLLTNLMRTYAYIYISGSGHDGEKPIKSNAKTRLDAMIPSDPLTPLTMPSINTKVNPHFHATLAFPHKPKATFSCWKNKKERRKKMAFYLLTFTFFSPNQFSYPYSRIKQHFIWQWAWKLKIKCK